MKKETKEIIGAVLIIVIISVAGALFKTAMANPTYYVAKMPDVGAYTVKVDGYMHKDKECCQKVADKFHADVISVKSKDVCGENALGQKVQYEDAFKYCPLCCD